MKAQLVGELRNLLEQKVGTSLAGSRHTPCHQQLLLEPCCTAQPPSPAALPPPPCCPTRPARPPPPLCALCCVQAGPSGMRIADLLDSINAQSSVRVSERDVRLALNELVSASDATCIGYCRLCGLALFGCAACLLALCCVHAMAGTARHRRRRGH